MRKGLVVLLVVLSVSLLIGLPLVASGGPTGRLLSVDTENLVGNRGLKLSWDVRNISGATTYLVEIKKFPDNSRGNPPEADNETRRTRIASNGSLRTVDITRLEPDGLYEFTIIPTNGSNYGTPAKIVKTAPSPTYVKGHQGDHTVLYKHGTFDSAVLSLIQGALPAAARAWDGSVQGISVCKDSSDCRGKNDGGAVTVKTVATTRDSHTGGCGTSFACVRDYTFTGSKTAIGKHIHNANMVFESPAFSCPKGTTCTKPTQWVWTATDTHGEVISDTDDLLVRYIRVQNVALHEFGHTLGLPEFGSSGASNYDSRLAGLDAIMKSLDGGAITSEDTKQLEAIYARHTKH